MKEARVLCGTCPMSRGSCSAPKRRRWSWKYGLDLTALEKDCPLAVGLRLVKRTGVG